ncbi:MAG: ABC transporter ATP-binding protein [Phycisphaerales bacterium]|nr:ABC transporter ATP-binding protein [Phycisphaerales bacterium]
MISVRGVHKSFGGVHAVRGVTFEVGKGQVVGLLGANGAGKTTTIRMITGFLPPDTGSVAVAGHDTLRHSLAARAAVGYLPESAPAYSEMSVDGFLSFRGTLYGMRRRDRRNATERVLGLCDLHEVRRRRVGHLSKGFRQRVGLAAAMLHDPPVLILDEPSNGLDPKQIGQARRLIRELARDRTVLVSSHILPEVEQTCDRVIIMARGQIRVDADPKELLGSLREASPYIVEARGDAAESVLRAVPGVERVEVTSRPALDFDGTAWHTFRITAAAGAIDLREPIAATCAARGILIRELRREAPGLERVFLSLIEADEEGLPSPPGRGRWPADGRDGGGSPGGAAPQSHGAAA